MRLFDPRWAPDWVPVRRRGGRRRFFRPGECRHLVLEALREAACLGAGLNTLIFQRAFATRFAQS